MVRYPSLYQVDTRVELTRLSRELGRPATLDDISDAAVDRWAQLGFDWVWMLSVWQTGAAARAVSRAREDWRKDFRETLPDLREEDICGSGFAITGYTVHERFGGDAALARLRERMRRRGIRLMLDFVPNHVAPDHPWVDTHPEYFVSGSEADLARAPQNYTSVHTKGGDRVLAYGRDPYFAGWPDTLQLNYGDPGLQDAQIAELLRIASLCDGVRCDMAMLVLPDVFKRTWGIDAAPFWPRAIPRVRERFPEFLFIAEVYWDLEWTLQQQGFDFTYDKRLYDRLVGGDLAGVRNHLRADPAFQDRSARFLENHDEPRAAATFPPGKHEAAALVTYFVPGLRFFQKGQLEGFRHHISPHLGRGPDEPTDPRLQAFYGRLLAALRDPLVRDGAWRLLECVPAWQGNESHQQFLAFEWEGRSGGSDGRLVVTVNLSPNSGQCFVRVQLPEAGAATWRFQDRIAGTTIYDRPGGDLRARGLYLDVAPWHGHVFSVTRLVAPRQTDRAAPAATPP
jgi:hypothetical protein